MKKSFTFYKRGGKFALAFISFFVLLLMFVFIAILEPSIVFYIIVALILAGILMFLHRAFVAKIIFAEDKIIYKSLFKTVELPNNDIKTISIVEKQKGQPIEFREYTPDFESRFMVGAHFVLIAGDMAFYPGNFFLYLKPICKEYITLEYRTELKPYLNALLDKI